MTDRTIEERLADLEARFHPTGKPMSSEEWNAKLAEERQARREDTARFAQVAALQEKRERLKELRVEVPKLTEELAKLEAEIGLE